MWKKITALGKSLEATYSNAWGWNIGEIETQKEKEDNRELNTLNVLRFYKVPT